MDLHLSGHQKISSHICFLYCLCYTIPHLTNHLIVTKNMFPWLLSLILWFIVSINEFSIKTILSFIIIEFIYTFDIYWIQLSLKYLSLCKPCHMERVISVKSNIILQIYFSSIYETDWRCYDYDRHCFSDKAVTSRQGSCHNI